MEACFSEPGLKCADRGAWDDLEARAVEVVHKRPYRYLKIHHLFLKGRHFIIETHPVLANVLRGKDEVTLTLFGIGHDDFLVGASDAIIDVKGASRLNLSGQNNRISCLSREIWGRGVGLETHRKVKCYFGILLLDPGEEARLFIGF